MRASGLAQVIKQLLRRDELAEFITRNKKEVAGD